MWGLLVALSVRAQGTGLFAEHLLPSLCDFTGQRPSSLIQTSVPGVGVHLLAEKRVASTFTWYMLCSIMRVCAYRSGDNRLYVACDVDLDADHPATVRVTKQHGMEASWGFDPSLASRPGDSFDRRGDSYLFLDFVVSNKPGFQANFVPARVAHTELFADFVKYNTAIVPLIYQPLFNLTEEESREVFSHMHSYGILRQCCSLQASVRDRPGDHWIGNAPDYDFPRCAHALCS